MKKYNIKDLKKDAINDSLALDTLFKKVFRTSIIYLSLSVFFLIFSCVFYKTVTYLSVISPLYLLIFNIGLIIFLIFNLIFSIIGYKRLDSRISLKIFNVYDIIGYIWFYIVLVVFILMYFFTPSTVVGSSMNNTLQSGDKVLVWHLGYKAKDDDIVLIHVTSKKYGPNTGGDDLIYIKRVVATSNDVVKYCDNEFYVNDSLVCEGINAYKFMQACEVKEIRQTTDKGEFYYNKDEGSIYINDVCIKSDVSSFMLDSYLDEYKITTITSTIKEDYSVCLGDNRDNSTDSRILGLFDNNDILGKAIFRFMPFNSIGKMKKDIRYGL